VVDSLPKAIPTLTGQGDVSQIVFLIDTSGSMQGRRIRTVKAAVSEFISRLGDQYLVSVLEFDTNAELRMGVTADHTAAVEATNTIGVDVEHDRVCLRDALYAGIQETSLSPVAEDARNMVIVLTDINFESSAEWNCRILLPEYIAALQARYPVAMYGIHVGDDVNEFSLSNLVSTLNLDSDVEGASLAANDKGEVDRALVSISEAARLHLKAQLTVSPTSAQPVSMVFVPPGEFVLGNNTVYLDAFWIDKTEVTNGMYARCVQAGQCNAPASNASRTRESYYGNAEFDHHPVILVSWADANAYCTWAGGRLPTEAEWEKAARGTDGRPYPWGDLDPPGAGDLLNFQAQDTAQVGLFPAGASPYGALDMAGNVSEWVADWLDQDYYSDPPPFNPLGPDSGQYRVWRGGSWANISPERIQTYSRTGNLPTDTSSGIGFRCARDAAP
jgi:formylglycine-generating enzyme required for sulfatase activity